MREIIEFVVHGPASVQIRKATIRPCADGPGYNVLVDGKLRYYGMKFDLEDALARIHSWDGVGQVRVVEISRRPSSVPDSLQSMVRGRFCASRFRLF
jgi:hypothetical protein